jgi:hypothetical protein
VRTKETGSSGNQHAHFLKFLILDDRFYQAIVVGLAPQSLRSRNGRMRMNRTFRNRQKHAKAV